MAHLSSLTLIHAGIQANTNWQFDSDLNIIPLTHRNTDHIAKGSERRVEIVTKQERSTSELAAGGSAKVDLSCKRTTKVKSGITLSWLCY